MKLLLKILQYLLMFFGVLFLIQVILIAWLWFADPFNVRSILQGGQPNGQTQTGQDSESTQDKHPLLTPEQEETVESFGIDPSTLPTELTAEQEQCLLDAVGEERAAEIEAGAEPTAMELIRAQTCF